MTITDNTTKSRYELDVEGEIVFADYQKSGNLVTILHVEAPLSLRGAGVAGKLMQGIVEKVRADGLKIKPVCSYAVTWLQRHKESHDLLA